MKRLSKEQIEQIVELYKSGDSSLKIARSFGITKAAVLYQLKKQNVDTTYKRKVLIEDHEKIIKLYEDGLSTHKIAKKFDVTNGCIGTILKKNKIKGRDKSITSRKYKIREDYFDKIDKQEKAYFLGMLYSDGSHYPKNNEIALYLHKKDIDVLKKLIKQLYIDERPLIKKKTNLLGFKIINKHISKKMLEYKIIQKKAATLRFPDFLNKEMVRHFIRGYLDGDGFISIKKRKLKTRLKRFGTIGLTGCYDFCNDAKKVLSDNINLKSYTYGPRWNNHGSLEIFKQHDVLKFLNWIYEDSSIHMDRKYNKYLEVKKN